MAVKWSIYVFFTSLIIVSVGCRTPQPVLKPEKTPEVLRIAPQGEARYDSSAYPKEALVDNTKRYTPDTKGGPPTRGGMAPGQGGMGGMRGMGQ